MTSFWMETQGAALEQGNYLPACWIPVVADDFAPEASPDEIAAEKRDLIFVTQSCDLANDNNRFAALSPYLEFTRGLPADPGGQSRPALVPPIAVSGALFPGVCPLLYAGRLAGGYSAVPVSRWPRVRGYCFRRMTRAAVVLRGPGGWKAGKSYNWRDGHGRVRLLGKRTKPEFRGPVIPNRSLGSRGKAEIEGEHPDCKRPALSVVW
jgi:hypothetical protein